MEEKKKKKIGIVPIIAAVVAILAIIGVAAFALFRSGFDFGLIGSMRSENTSEYLYENTSKISKSALGKGFAVLTGTEVRAYNEKGEETYLSFIVFDEPVLSVSGGCAVAYDEGGRSLISCTERGESWRAETEGAIVSAFVNSDGYLAVATDEAGYGGSVTVYNPSGRALYKWYSGANYIVSGKIRGKTDLMTLSIGKSGSDLRFYRIDDEAEQGSFTSTGVILDAGFNASGVTVVTQDKLVLLGRNYGKRGEYDFAGKHLDGYTIGESFTLLVLSDYAVGGARELVLVDADGTQAGSLTLSDLEGWAISGRTVAVAAAGRLDFYNVRFERSYSAEYNGVCDRLCLRDENTAIICGDYSARVVSATRKGE